MEYAVVRVNSAASEVDDFTYLFDSRNKAEAYMYRQIEELVHKYPRLYPEEHRNKCYIYNGDDLRYVYQILSCCAK